MPSRKPTFIYQIRTTWFEDPYDLVGHLTHAVWNALTSDEDLRTLDPHRWPGLYMAFRNAFRGRLVSYKDCGDIPVCAGTLPAYAEQPVNAAARRPRIYVLELRKELKYFINGLADIVIRRLRDAFPKEKELRRYTELKVRVALRNTLSPYLYVNEACQNCAVRQRPADRRLWPTQWSGADWTADKGKESSKP